MPLLPCKLLRSSRARMFASGLFILLLLLTVITSYHYYENRSHILKRVDQSLYNGALAMRYAISDNFHAQQPATELTPSANYTVAVTTLTSLCNDLHLDFLYTLVQRDEHLYFALSSLAAQELAAGDFYHYFSKPYAVLPAQLSQLTGTAPIYFDFTDHLGSFRTVLIPCVSANGRHYVAGAAINSAVIGAALAGTYHRALIECLVLLILAFPLTALFVWPLQCQLYTDELTGLANRTKLKKDLSRCRSPYLMLIDIDAFKDINSYYGVQVGDQLLIKLGEALRAVVPDETKLYRLDGDEYALLCEAALNCLSVDYVVERINELRIEIEDTQFRVSITAGVAQGSQKVIEHADLALKEAKRVLKPYKLYSAHLQTVQNSRANLLWTAKLKEALDTGRLVAYYQPIHDNDHDNISHYEALIRLVDEDGTVVGPDFFMDAARKSRVYSQLTMFMLDAALNFIEQKNVSCTVNLLNEDIVVEESRQHIIDRIRKSPAREKLIFEIVESEGIDNYAVIKSFIDQARIYGVQVAIDDFGTGYSNFDHISNLDIDYIKIDGGLIAQLNDSARAKTIVESIIHFSRELNIKIIAEYVATEALQYKVAQLGIDYSQGYFWGKPQPLSVENRVTHQSRQF